MSEPSKDNPPEKDAEQKAEELVEEVIEKLRGGGVGTEDPNIVGDVGPTDIPPGKDPDTEND